MTPTCYETLLTDLAASLSLDAAALIRSQELCFNGVSIGLFPDDAFEGARYACVIGELPQNPSDATALKREMLRANYFGRATGGATLGLQLGGRHVVLSGCTPARFGAEILLDDIYRIEAVANFWREAIQQPQAALHNLDAQHNPDARRDTDADSRLPVSFADHVPDSYQVVLAQLAECLALDSIDLFMETSEVDIDGVSVQFMPDGEGAAEKIVFSARVGWMKERAHCIDDVRQLLQANALWAGTGGATLGMQVHTGALVLCDKLLLRNLTGEKLARRLASFVEVVGCWREWLAQPSDTALALSN